MWTEQLDVVRAPVGVPPLERRWRDWSLPSRAPRSYDPSMHRAALGIVFVVAACGPKHLDLFPTRPLGELVGSWSTAKDGRGERHDLDVDRSGRYRTAWYDADGHHLCTRTGGFWRMANDYLWLKATDDENSPTLGDDAYSNTCRGDAELSAPLTEVTADAFSYRVANDDDTVTYYRRPGPLIADALIGVDDWPKEAAVAVAEPTPDGADAPASDVPRAPSGPSPPPDPVKANQDALERALEQAMLAKGYVHPNHTSEHGRHWIAAPRLLPRTGYMVLIMVPVAAGDAHAWLRINGQTGELRRDASGARDARDYYLFVGYATSGDASTMAPEDGGLEVEYTADSDALAILYTFETQ
jgi:hypothetical protein